MKLRMTTVAERPDLRGPLSALHRAAWPKFMPHDPFANRYWGELFNRFPEYQSVFCNDDDQPVAVGNTLPIRWNGNLSDLPAGWDAALECGVTQHSAGYSPTALCALAAAVHPASQGHGLSSAVIGAMKQVAADHCLSGLIAPVRPSLKSLYLLTPFDQYLAWTREDGLPFDPWLRVHARLGARRLQVAPRSMVITGTVAEWEEWTGMRFPESGRYVVPGALEPITIDCEADQGIYVEPNLWLRHDSAPAGAAGLAAALPPAT